MSFSLHDCGHHTNYLIRTSIQTGKSIQEKFRIFFFHFIVARYDLRQDKVAHTDSLLWPALHWECRHSVFTQLSKIQNNCWSKYLDIWGLNESSTSSDLSLYLMTISSYLTDWHESRISTGFHERFSSAMWEFCEAKIRLIWTLCFWSGPQQPHAD